MTIFRGNGRTVTYTIGGVLSVFAVLFVVAHLPMIDAALLMAAAAFSGVALVELLRSRRRLVEEHAANLSKSTYLANMSHELRTPLNAIIGFSDMIRSETLGPVACPKYVEYADDIHSSAEHLLDMINDVMDLARIESGHFEIRESEVDLSVLLGSCLRMLRQRARNHGVDLGFEAPESCQVLCDAPKIRQIIINLLVNAIKFTPPGGRVCLRLEKQAHGVRIEVIDTGVGIAAKDIERVLIPFYQSARTKLLPNDGVGLGLPLARRLAELHGGSLRLESELGQGTQAIVTLPRSCLRALPGHTAEAAVPQEA
jgi:signal transduction histidine kinase